MHMYVLQHMSATFSLMPSGINLVFRLSNILVSVLMTGWLLYDTVTTTNVLFAIYHTCFNDARCNIALAKLKKSLRRQVYFQILDKTNISHDNLVVQ